MEHFHAERGHGRADKPRLAIQLRERDPTVRIQPAHGPAMQFSGLPIMASDHPSGPFAVVPRRRHGHSPDITPEMEGRGYGADRGGSFIRQRMRS